MKSFQAGGPPREHRLRQGGFAAFRRQKGADGPVSGEQAGRREEGSEERQGTAAGSDHLPSNTRRLCRAPRWERTHWIRFMLRNSQWLLQRQGARPLGRIFQKPRKGVMWLLRGVAVEMVSSGSSYRCTQCEMWPQGRTSATLSGGLSNLAEDVLLWKLVRLERGEEHEQDLEGTSTEVPVRAAPREMPVGRPVDRRGPGSRCWTL